MSAGDKAEPRWDGVVRNDYDWRGFRTDLAEGQEHERRFQDVLAAPTWEHKWDRQTRQTGKVFIEYAEVRRGIEKPTGIATTEARVWALEFAPECRLVLPVWAVASLALLAKRQGLTVNGGNGNRFKGALIPLEWFFRCWVYVDLDKPLVNWSERFA